MQCSLNIHLYILFSLLFAKFVTSDYVTTYCYITCTVDLACSSTTFHHYVVISTAFSPTVRENSLKTTTQVFKN